MSRIGRIVVAALLGLAFVAAPAVATTTTPTGVIKGQVEKTWLKAGGVAKLGDPVGKETRIVAFGRATYHQHTTEGAIVYWDGSQGGKVWLAGKVPNLAKVTNERDAMAGSGLKAGVVFRSAKLCDSTTADDRLLTAMLHGGKIIDLRTSGTASRCKDPSLPGVSKVRYGMSATANPATFVTAPADRKAVAAVLKAIAAEDGPVLLHCTHGKDRTGWIVGVILMLAGKDVGTVKAEYMRSGNVRVSDFDKGIKAMYDKYDGVEGYVRDGLGLSQATIDKLVAKVS